MSDVFTILFALACIAALVGICVFAVNCDERESDIREHEAIERRVALIEASIRRKYPNGIPGRVF